MKNKFKSYSFWMSVCAAVVLVINNLAKTFGFSFDNQNFTTIVDSVCGVLVVLGILTMPKEKNDNTQQDDFENKIEESEKNENVDNLKNSNNKDQDKK